jgi:hypothetical protein
MKDQSRDWCAGLQSASNVWIERWHLVGYKFG